MLDHALLNLLVCPACGEEAPLHVAEDRGLLICDRCRRGYPMREGIPVLLLDEAVSLDEAPAAPGTAPAP